MFITSHLMFAYILYELFNLDANLWIFLGLSILPDITWPLHKNHRKTSWWHTPLTFIWVLLWPQYAVAVISHFILDLTYGIRLTPWNKELFGLMIDKEKKRVSKKVFLPIRIIKHVYRNYYSRIHNLIIEIVLLIITSYLILN